MEVRLPEGTCFTYFTEKITISRSQAEVKSIILGIM